MFLQHLKNKANNTNEEETNERVIAGPDGISKGHVLFVRYEDVNISSSCLENGEFLTIGHVGYNSEVSG